MFYFFLILILYPREIRKNEEIKFLIAEDICYIEKVGKEQYDKVQKESNKHIHRPKQREEEEEQKRTKEV